MPSNPSQSPPDRLLVDAPTAAKMLGVGRTTVAKLTAEGRLPSVKIDRRRLFPVDGLRAFVARLGEGVADD